MNGSRPKTGVQVAEQGISFENGDRRPYPRTLDAIRRVLEAAGVEFINGDAPGVRLRQPD